MCTSSPCNRQSAQSTMNLTNLAIFTTKLSETKTTKYFHNPTQGNLTALRNNHQGSNPTPTVCPISFLNRVIRLLEPSGTSAKVNYTKLSGTNPSSAKSEHSPRGSHVETYASLPTWSICEKRAATSCGFGSHFSKLDSAFLRHTITLSVLSSLPR